MGRLIQNIGGGGGVSSDEVTATTGDVLKGKTAVTSDSNDEVATGTLELTGNAADADVLEGKTYYNTDAKAKKNGTMTDYSGETVGAKAVSIDDNTKEVVATVARIGKYSDTSKLTISFAPLNNQTGLTADKLANGQTVLGVTGTYKGLGNATAADVREGKTFSTGSLSNATGTMAEKGAQTYTPKTTNQTIAANQYLTGVQTIAGDADLTAGNIRTGANIFGVAGTYKGLGNAAQANVESGKTFSTASLSNASGSMAVMSGGSYTPSKSAQTISCSGKKMSSNITINAIPSNYVDPSVGCTVFNNGTFLSGYGMTPNGGMYKNTYGSASNGNLYRSRYKPSLGGNGGSVITGIGFNTDYYPYINVLNKSIDLTKFNRVSVTYTTGNLRDGEEDENYLVNGRFDIWIGAVDSRNTSSRVYAVPGMSRDIIYGPTKNIHSNTKYTDSFDISSIKGSVYFGFTLPRGSKDSGSYSVNNITFYAN